MYKINNFFSEEDIKKLNFIIDKTDSNIDENLGRVQKTLTGNVDSVIVKLNSVVKNLFKKDLVLGSVSYVEYSAKYGSPNLPPHVDRDKVEIIVDYQLESNTSWGLGLNMDFYQLEDNSALIFNPNNNIHWRPIKNFENGEYVKMIFFRFHLVKNGEIISDYTGLEEVSINDELFKEINDYRNILHAKSEAEK